MDWSFRHWNSIGDIFNSNIDIRFCPYEEIEIWKNRFLDIKVNGFKDLIVYMNFGEQIHYIWRLEFQARGAPHIHTLIWLKDRLDISKTDSSFYATMPLKETDKPHSLDDGPTIHSCNFDMCKKGGKYRLIKKKCGETHITDYDELLLKRRLSDSNIVEYSTYFLWKWQVHCHVHVFEFTKSSLNVQFEDISKKSNDSKNSNFGDLFHAKKISVEDAISNIFSTQTFWFH